MISDNQLDAGFYLFIKQIENSLDSFGGFDSDSRYHYVYETINSAVCLAFELLPEKIEVEVR